MPELPEVESFRRSLQQYCLGCTIEDVIAVEQGGGPREGLFDELVLNGGSAGQFMQSIKGKGISSVERKGKQILLKFGHKTKKNGLAGLLMHLGMTGAIVVKGKPLPKFKEFKVSESWPPKFTKLEMILDNGERVAFCDPRRLGRIRIVENFEACEHVTKLAIDPINESLTFHQARESLSQYSSAIKAVLLDQEKLCCGIGNWVADEVLCHAGIHPTSRANELSDESIQALVNSINYVLQTAVDANADSTLYPSDWLFHSRWRSSRGKQNRGAF
jgi:formamidopyrimidine-DNA glycosylase